MPTRRNPAAMVHNQRILAAKTLPIEASKSFSRLREATTLQETAGTLSGSCP